MSDKGGGTPDLLRSGSGVHCVPPGLTDLLFAIVQQVIQHSGLAQEEDLTFECGAKFRECTACRAAATTAKRTLLQDA